MKCKGREGKLNENLNQKEKRGNEHNGRVEIIPLMCVTKSFLVFNKNR